MGDKSPARPDSKGGRRNGKGARRMETGRGREKTMAQACESGFALSRTFTKPLDGISESRMRSRACLYERYIGYVHARERETERGRGEAVFHSIGRRSCWKSEHFAERLLGRLSIRLDSRAYTYAENYWASYRIIEKDKSVFSRLAFPSEKIFSNENRHWQKKQR